MLLTEILLNVEYILRLHANAEELQASEEEDSLSWTDQSFEVEGEFLGYITPPEPVENLEVLCNFVED